MGLIPCPVQWVKDLVLPQLWLSRSLAPEIPDALGAAKEKKNLRPVFLSPELPPAPAARESSLIKD